MDFNPRAPYGARPDGEQPTIYKIVKISIHAPHTGRDPKQDPAPQDRQTISIHAPHTGRDPALQCRFLPTQISIHAPHTGRDSAAGLGHGGHHISIHAPHTGRDAQIVGAVAGLLISIHAPHTGRDSCPQDHPPPSPGFQSTRPIRGATIIHYSLSFPSNLYFNPRAPYGARPLPSLLRHWIRTYFNPRAPYGARLRSLSSSSVSYTFQSTRPIRGATRGRPHFCGRGPISIHAPHTGRDLLWSRY